MIRQAICVLVLLATATEVHAGPRKVAMVLVENQAVDVETANRFLADFRAQVGKLPKVKLVNKSGAGNKATERCHDRCLAAIAKKHGADELVVVLLNIVDDLHLVDLRLVSAATAKEEVRLTEQIRCRNGVFDQQNIRAAAYKLLQPDLYVGAIQVNLDLAGAEVFVDGRSVGVTPLKGPITGVKPGSRALRIAKQGLLDYNGFVEVKFDDVSVVNPVLQDSVLSAPVVAMDSSSAATLAPAPPLLPLNAGEQPTTVASRVITKRRVASLITGGLGLAAVGVGGYFGKKSHDAQKKLTDLQIGGKGPVQHSEQAKPFLDDMRSNGNTANTLFITGGLAIATGVVLWFTGGEKAPVKPTVSVGTSGATLGISGNY